MTATRNETDQFTWPDEHVWVEVTDWSDGPVGLTVEDQACGPFRAITEESQQGSYLVLFPWTYTNHGRGNQHRHGGSGWWFEAARCRVIDPPTEPTPEPAYTYPAEAVRVRVDWDRYRDNGYDVPRKVSEVPSDTVFRAVAEAPYHHQVLLPWPGVDADLYAAGLCEGPHGGAHWTVSNAYLTVVTFQPGEVVETFSGRGFLVDTHNGHALLAASDQVFTCPVEDLLASDGDAFTEAEWSGIRETIAYLHTLSDPLIERTHADNLRINHQQWLRRFNVAAWRYGDDVKHCPEWDRHLRSLGLAERKDVANLPGIPEDGEDLGANMVEVTVSHTYEGTVWLSASTLDTVLSNEVESYYDWDCPEGLSVSTRVTVTTEVVTPDGECACNSVDDDSFSFPDGFELGDLYSSDCRFC